VCYEGQILLDLEWGDTNENNNEREDRVSENENDSRTNGENERRETRGERNENERRETQGCDEGESSIPRGCESKRRRTWGCDEGKSSVPLGCENRGCENERISHVFNEDAGRVYERRVRHPPSYLSDYITTDELTEDEAYMVQNVSTGDPIYFKEVVKDEKWRRAMDSEISSIEKNKTWSLSELPTRAKTIGVKWVYKTKYNEHGEIDKHKARLVAKGYSQKHGIDYTEVFAQVARMDTVRMIIALAAQNNWRIFQLDVKSAFLYGELSEEVYIEQPRGYETKGKEHIVIKHYMD